MRLLFLFLFKGGFISEKSGSRFFAADAGPERPGANTTRPIRIDPMIWSEPKNSKEWIKGMFTLQPLILALILACVLITELRFDWFEHLVGRYLASTNAFRPQSGAVWEASHRTLAARRTLEQIVTERRDSQREARSAGSLAQIADSIADNHETMLSAHHFQALYRQLPAPLAAEIVSPLNLLVIRSKGQWVRTYIEKTEDGLAVYLLNKNNRVLRRLAISRDLLQRIRRNDRAGTCSLDNLPGFENRIYPAELFFTAFADLSEDARQSILPDPERVLNASGPVVRVGIADEIRAGTIELGFEIQNADHPEVTLVRGQDWAIWRLHARIKALRSHAAPERMAQP